MINEIEIRNRASFDNTGIKIKDLKKINFIYGANGSGKTTISNFLSESVSIKNDCSYIWKDDHVLDILVYNKEFREKYFSNDSIDGVFTIGKESVDKQKEIEAKKNELEIIKEEDTANKNTLQAQKDKKNNTEESFKKKAWSDIYKKYERIFKEAFQGFLKQESFKKKLLKCVIDNDSSLSDIDKLKGKASTIFGQQPEHIDLLMDIVFDDIKKIENNPIWKTKIIGKSDVNISKLIQHLNIDDWVNQGRNYLQSKTCPFCQEETITDDFKEQLKKYFDKEYLEQISGIEKYQLSYQSSLNSLTNQLEDIKRKVNSNQNIEMDIEVFSNILIALVSKSNTNKCLLEKKIKEPSRDIELASTTEQLEQLKQLIDDSNKKITAHNSVVANLQKEKEKLIIDIWSFIAQDNIDMIEEYKEKIKGLEKGIKKLTQEHKDKQTKWTSIEEDIQKLSQYGIGTQVTIDFINKTLIKFSFLNFSIEPSIEDKNKYQLKRENGDLAQTSLSEGEITFITLLYFIQLTKGSTDKSNIANNKILVVDDPVSSLDSNVLFIVSTLLKQIIEDTKNDTGNIKQVIFLTHNIYFHKEVSFINSRETENKYTNYWILRKNNKISSIESYGIKNPIKTSYELLWQELKDRKNISNTAIQNTMRRIIEYYFTIIGRYSNNNRLIKTLKDEDQEIGKALLSWINEGSHGISDDLYMEHRDDVQEKFMSVFKYIFKDTGHIEHYNMMMGENIKDKLINN
jgi:wobble nucleotide-excising tRNase